MRSVEITIHLHTGTLGRKPGLSTGFYGFQGGPVDDVSTLVSRL